MHNAIVFLVPKVEEKNQCKILHVTPNNILQPQTFANLEKRK
jgi:hypothetical protein